MSISNEAFQKAAKELDVEVAKIKAVSAVESRHSGFLESGEPKILFEAHWFSSLTDGIYDDTHPNISSPQWDRSLYEGGQEEHERLQKAVELNREAALKSASWGKFQILGINWDKCGYESLQDFINAMYESEEAHLEAFIGFIKNEGLAESLKESDWHEFARIYNGENYAENRYAERMKEAYEDFKE